MNVFIVNHHLSEVCGIHQSGKVIAANCASSTRHTYHYIEADSREELLAAISERGCPEVIIYNYYPSTMGWAERFALPGVMSVGILYEGGWANALTPEPHFPFWIWHDPSLEHRSTAPNVFWCTRPLPAALPAIENKPEKTIGSFGFAMGHKGFENFVTWANRNRPSYRIRLHIPQAHFGPDEAYSKQLHDAFPFAQISTGFLSVPDFQAWLAGNDEHALFSGYNPNRGLASAADWAIATGKPLTLTHSHMFRHIHEAYGFTQEDTPEVYTYDTKPLRKLWSTERFMERHDDIIDALGQV